MPATTIGTSSTAWLSMTISRANGSNEARRILKDDGTIWVIGSYHNIYRVGVAAAGCRLLDPQRHRLAQGQSDAEFPRHALHQRPRDPAVVREGRKGALHLQLSRDEGAQRRPPDAQRLGAPDLFGVRNVARTMQATRRIRRKSPKACFTAFSSPARSRATSCSIRSSARARPARWRGGWAASGSGSSAKPLM